MRDEAEEAPEVPKTMELIKMVYITWLTVSARLTALVLLVFRQPEQLPPSCHVSYTNIVISYLKNGTRRIPPLANDVVLPYMKL